METNQELGMATRTGLEPVHCHSVSGLHPEIVEIPGESGKDKGQADDAKGRPLVQKLVKGSPKLSLLEVMAQKEEFILDRMEDFVEVEGGCWEWTKYVNKEGYGVMTITTKQDGRRTFLAHRVSYAFYTGDDPGPLLVCHACDNRKCINPSHLNLGTHADNSEEAVVAGRTLCQAGDLNHSKKITSATVIQIVEAIKAGKGNTEIAAGLTVGHSLVSLIRNGKAWRSVLSQIGYEPSQYRRRSV